MAWRLYLAACRTCGNCRCHRPVTDISLLLFRAAAASAWPPLRDGAGAPRAGLAERGAALLRADRAARRAGGGQCLRRQDGRRTAIRCWTTRSSGASSACRASRRRADAALARLRRPRRRRPASSSPTTTSSKAPTRSRSRSSDKREFEAEIVLKDTRSDLAVLRSEGRQASTSPRSNSPIPTRCRSATSCSRSAIRSASARP